MKETICAYEYFIKYSKLKDKQKRILFHHTRNEN